MIMRQILKYTGYILALLIIGFLIYKFYYIIGWLLIAAVLSFIGEPLVRYFGKIHINKYYIPHWLSSLLALLVIFLFIASLIGILVPLIISQAEAYLKLTLIRSEQSCRVRSNGWIINCIRQGH